ncbi:hypothetical protein [Polaromonas sp.]|uniref:hypothetical protein n=1 Tax=Polaromonas sp. TaxID=1869339 RepID=UPI00286A5970|nr:hypothetical protein [Polaromonas sp.]
MSHATLSTLVNAQLQMPLRALALTVEEDGPGEFRWRVLERRGQAPVFEALACSDITFAAYDTALASGYGELQRLVGPDLQYGPRLEPDFSGNGVPRSGLSAPAPQRPGAAA